MTPPEERQADRDRLAKLLDERRAELRLRWRDVAERAGITVEGLRTLRVGTGRIRSTTKRGLEDALEWRPGSIEAILDGGEPVARPAVRAHERGGQGADGPAALRLPLRVQGELAERTVLDFEVADLAWPGSEHRLIVLWTGPPHVGADLEEVRREYAAWTRGRHRLGEVFAAPPEEEA